MPPQPTRQTPPRQESPQQGQLPYQAAALLPQVLAPRDLPPLPEPPRPPQAPPPRPRSSNQRSSAHGPRAPTPWAPQWRRPPQQHSCAHYLCRQREPPQPRVPRPVVVPLRSAPPHHRPSPSAAEPPLRGNLDRASLPEAPPQPSPTVHRPQRQAQRQIYSQGLNRPMPTSSHWPRCLPGRLCCCQEMIPACLQRCQVARGYSRQASASNWWRLLQKAPARAYS
mmetsp:Transcript_113818/g.361764  ORF Transcript_113818/g.361764 Transcript_113818/m.361764 type:complete len:224 (+) Transcript_113818:1572-2243(+)